MSSASKTSSPGDAKDEAQTAVQNLKDFAQDKVIEPIAEAGKHVAQAAKDGTAKVAEYTREAVRSTDQWVGSHPYPSAGIAFCVGLLLGIVVTAQIRD